MSPSPQEVSSFLPQSAASKAAQQGAVAPAGMSLEGRGEALGGRSETQPLKVAQAHSIPIQFTAQEAKLPKEPEVARRKCCHLVDTFCNYNSPSTRAPLFL